jgi:ABC-type nitrate/sulfonate/bicarbonate transport system permease component
MSPDPATGEAQPPSVAAEAVRRRRATRGWLAQHENAVLKSIGVLSVLGLWEAVVDIGWGNPAELSSPSRVAQSAIAYIGTREFFADFASSALEFVVGFGLAVIVGIGLGFATGWFRRLELLLDPIINFLYAAPRIAMTPLIVLWFGIDLASKVVVIFLMAVFPIIINTAVGVRSVDGDLRDLARSFNASGWQLLRTIVVPSAIPFIVTGLRLAIGVAFIGVVVGEFVAATSGIGFAIQQAASSFEVDRVFVGLIIIGFAGVALTEALRHLETRLARWKTR